MQIEELNQLTSNPELLIRGLEMIADQIVGEQTGAKTQLQRKIRAYSRIIEAREPGKFTRKPVEYADEDGHWDNSFPPKQEYKNYTGPRLFRVITRSTSTQATSGGFYHSFEYATEDPGLYIAPGGELYGSDLTGTGSFGQYAAHPGNCEVNCTIEYSPLDLDAVPIDRLQKAEKELRAICFPLVAARETTQSAPTTTPLP